MIKKFKTLLAQVIKRRKPLFEPLYTSFEATKRGRTEELYEATLRKLRTYCPDFKNLSVDDVTVEWLHGFDSWMAGKGLSRNSRCIHLRNIRTVYYIAIDEGMAVKNPFRRFKIRGEATRKRSLTAAQLRKLAEAEVEPWQEKYRDAFLLMFMLRGINSVDFCHLKNIENGFIRYRRSKTGRLFEIRVEPEAMELIRKLRGKGQLLYPLDSVSDYRRYTSRLNAELKRIASGIKGMPPITSYWARHTWATIAARLDIPKETISRGLGHSTKSVTDIYIDFDMRKVHAANRKIIRYVFGKPHDKAECEGE